ncbi:urease accessory protein UreH domain-containing protein [Methylocucumis oryzae]|uniref:Heavy metal transport/detoxification protein n=1 Tax=Methylocucumis oryzae TaxID=1632867 RepID=A0A0F3IFR2_9GAMM|nr:sulfite exporter TauE/SafE family protein [Methylocucumis oryzae]KJV05576.1 heavy metal transport/detoxification protein [Methylocucumis oryzae]
MAMRNLHLTVEHMVCRGCEQTIIESVSALPGVLTVTADYIKQEVWLKFDDSVIDLADISKVIEAKGYSIIKHRSRLIDVVTKSLVFLLLLGIVAGIALWGKAQMPGIMTAVDANMTDTMVLLVGFLTGFHCIGMCGGFVVAYTDTRQTRLRQLLAHLYYGFGKTLSYAFFGAVFGFVGAVIAITPLMRGSVQILAGAFLILYGLKMLNVFSLLRRLTLRLPRNTNQQVTGLVKKHKSPLATGLLTGLLLGCGPLQAMYVLAAGTADPLQGAKSLFLFSLGTLGPLLGFGVFASAIPITWMRQLVKVSGLLVLIMGGMMMSHGLNRISSQHKVGSTSMMQSFDH